ncbi:MAG: DUF192 domain-containing protein [Nanoarchaeota archaeon]
MWLLTFLIILFALFIYFIFRTNESQVCFSENCFDVEVVSSQEELSKGLMFRESLNENSGMLFIFPKEDFHNFWMKNTLIPLDIIWINSAKEIVFIENNAQPCLKDICESFTPDEKALYVLEINSGIAEEIGLKVGDEVNFKIN